MVMVLEDEMVREIEKIGKLRYPNEACGILLPVPHKGKSVFELPNRSKEPADSFELWGTDIMLQLEAIDPELMDSSPEELAEYTIWHTHPRSHVGPSATDLENKPAFFKHLVIAISEEAPPVPTWF